MIVILTAVALVRAAGIRKPRPAVIPAEAAVEFAETA
jgi:hypothetical protein